MENNNNKEPYQINLLSLNCHLTINSKGSDKIMLKYRGKRLYPQGGSKFIEFETGDAHKFLDFHILGEKNETSEPLMIELWRYNNFFRNTLVGRFFLITDLSQMGFSATQLIRNSEHDQSNYLLHWEKQSLSTANKEVKVSSEELHNSNN